MIGRLHPNPKYSTSKEKGGEIYVELSKRFCTLVAWLPLYLELVPTFA